MIIYLAELTREKNEIGKGGKELEDPRACKRLVYPPVYPPVSYINTIPPPF